MTKKKSELPLKRATPTKDACKEFEKWLIDNKQRYVRPSNSGPGRNGIGSPHFLVFTRSLKNCAVLFKDDRSLNITKGQYEYIDYLEATGWIIKLAFSLDEATQEIERLNNV